MLNKAGRDLLVLRLLDQRSSSHGPSLTLQVPTIESEVLEPLGPSIVGTPRVGALHSKP